MDKQLLAEIEKAHISTACDLPACWACADDWPCETAQVVAEVRRLQKALEMLLAVVGTDATEIALRGRVR